MTTPAAAHAALELAALPTISRLSANVIRVLGQNPGPYTLQGSNVYLLGNKRPYVLIDTGEGRPQFIPHLKEVLSPRQAGPLISDIIITHKHRDHWGGTVSILELLQELWSTTQGNNEPFKAPRLHKFPLPESELDHRDAHAVHLTETFGTLSPALSRPPVLTNIPSLEISNSLPFHLLSPDQIIQGQGVSLQTIYTPGHTADSICLYLPEEGALFTADSILGQGTAVFEDLGLYLDSLHHLLNIFSPEDKQLNVIYPGHGPTIEGEEKTIGTIKQYIDHRLEREKEFITVLESNNEGEEYKYWSPDEILAQIYPEKVWAMARRGLMLHLAKLERDGRVKKVENDGEVKWKALPLAG